MISMGETVKSYRSKKVDLKIKSVTDVNSQNILLNEEDDERTSLLPPPPKLEKPQRKVKWKDNYGKKLTEVLEYELSEVSDSEEEDLDTCSCTIL